MGLRTTKKYIGVKIPFLKQQVKDVNHKVDHMINITVYETSRLHNIYEGES